MIVLNQYKNPVVQANFATLSKFIYIIEKDTKNVLQYDRYTNRVGRMKLNYRVNNLEVALPHNYQVVQCGDEPKLYLIGGGDY